MTAAGRRAAEAQMARRDRLERAGGRGRRAARRSRAPAFLDSDDAIEEDLDDVELARMKRRTRRQYDERRDIDDLEGVEDVCRFLVFNTPIEKFRTGITIRAIERYQGEIHR
jgi:DNA replication licensing factor MCM2